MTIIQMKYEKKKKMFDDIIYTQNLIKIWKLANSNHKLDKFP